jgi:type II secretory pathway pseudopilin PulG
MKGVRIHQEINPAPHHGAGFTFIEILVIVAIVGILVGIVLVSLGGARVSTRDARRQADIQQIASALESYFNANSFYVSSAVVPSAIGTSLVSVDPQTQADYAWVDNTTDSQDFCVYAKLEKKPGTAGNIVYFMAGPIRFGEREVAANFIFSLTDCE